MAITKYIMFSGLLLISACGQMFITSTAVFQRSEENVEMAETIKDSVFRRVAANNGECFQPNNETVLVSCLMPSKMSVDMGINQEGYVFIQLDSGVATLLPTSQTKLEKGYYLPDDHREWENWINTEFADYDLVEKTRHTTGGIVQEF